MTRCFLAQFSDQPCQGRLIRAHLLPKQLLKREIGEGWAKVADDRRSWVPSCGGLVGLAGHHHELDYHSLQIPRESLPAGLQELCEELGLSWYLDRRFGRLESPVA